jgi:nucleoside 2-deoxyribosyltransferase
VKTVYLAGPINGTTDEEMHGWRDELTNLLTGFEIVSPVVRDYRGREDENVTDIVEGDKADIHRSDVIVAHCPKPSVGTSMEVLYAWERGKLVIIYIPVGVSVSPWLRYHSTAICHTASEVVKEVHQ